MRHVVGDRIGRTDFFRNPAFLRALVDLLRAEEAPRVLVHAAAMGAEPYSLVMAARLAGLQDIRVEAADIEPSFLEMARREIYGDDCLDKVPAEARMFFLPGPERELSRLRLKSGPASHSCSPLRSSISRHRTPTTRCSRSTL